MSKYTGPTLLKPNQIKPQKWMTTEEKRKLLSISSIEWVINYLVERNWIKTNPPRNKITGIGSKVSVFRSGTGTGKSTVIPPAIFNKFYDEMGVRKTIICTQPTVASTTDLPFQVAMYNKNLIVGETIGFQTGTLVRKPVNGILYATIGILLQHMKIMTDEEFMNKYSFIIIDEIHTRSVEMDIVLLYLRKFLIRNYKEPNCPYIILMSGTFEPEIYMSHFECKEDCFLDISGYSYPIIDNYTKVDVSNYLEFACDLIAKIHIENLYEIDTLFEPFSKETLSKETNKETLSEEETHEETNEASAEEPSKVSIFRDIIVFVQGSKQMMELINMIHKLNTDIFSKSLDDVYSYKSDIDEKLKIYYGGKTEKKYYLCPIAAISENIQNGGIDFQNMYSEIDSIVIPIYKFEDGEITEEILRKETASRRVIVATNALETGITIDTLKYCIDTGFVNESQFNPNFGVSVLLEKAVTKSSILQRRGRIGRKSPGEFYACYTKETFDSMFANVVPDILRSDIARLTLDSIIVETETTLEEIEHELYLKYNKEIFENGISEKHSYAFQMNIFENRWYALKYNAKFNLSNIVFVSYPSADSFLYGFEKLRLLGLIDENINPTIFGWYCSKIRKLNIESIRMILASYHHEASTIDLITISCMLANSNDLGINRRKYTGQNLFNLHPDKSEEYNRVIFADDFIDYLFLWNRFIGYIDKNKNIMIEYFNDKKRSNNSDLLLDKEAVATNIKKLSKSNINLVKNVEDWCIENKISFDAMMRVVSLRDEIINDMINIGLNPFYNDSGINVVSLLKKNINEGINELVKIKKCIYEGYKMNLYIYNKNSHGYFNVITHNKIKIDDFILKVPEEELLPKKIIVGSIIVKKTMNKYEFIGNTISVMDNFVNIDSEFYMK